MNARKKAELVLADGTSFPGYLFGATPTAEISGAATVTTNMFAYEREMTDPARKGQVLIFAAPQVGNAGWNDEDVANSEGRITVGAVVVRDLTARVSNFRSVRTLEEAMTAQGISGIYGVDTRKLVRHLSQTGNESVVATLVVKEEN
ncbi:carbamoyl-phosphate synthase domain-containing protein [Corynebacterium riegelii]|uniref:carbamoyl-phosphate synthase domain-containing protein n=1 Tax=Corynebacterium riegelii TaxID=156976 RepID=UPI00191D15CB|nr:carbamoyl-phosphate synthase domain-containing protein [Corynebacterium riegelii]QQU83651.1 hypothetical protein I6I71_09735 [Corynebacterium riegelii]